MLKQTVTYENFDGQQVTEDLYFNITKTELADQIDKADEIASLQTMLSGPARELSVSEVKRILEVVKWLLKLSYGVRSDDGKRFIKGEHIWTEFTQTAAYDAFLFSLFSQPEKAVQFMVGVVPSDLRGDVERETMKRMNDFKEQGQVVTGNVFEQFQDEAQADDTIRQQMPAVAPVEDKPAPMFENMSREELLERLKNQQS